jgi:hypothetical protein
MQKRADGRYVVTLSCEGSEGAERRHFVHGKTQAEANAKSKAAISGSTPAPCARRVTDARRLTGRVASDRPDGQ